MCARSSSLSPPCVRAAIRSILVPRLVRDRMAARPSRARPCRPLPRRGSGTRR
jgi:hypothetical protein